jgi:hypothetical protein
MKKALLVALSFAFLGSVSLPATGVAASKTCVMVYEHVNYKGKKKTFCGNVKNLKPYGLNDKISSFQITGGNKQVSFYFDANYKGKRFIAKKDSVGINSKKLPPALNDKVSSIKIG